MNNPVSLYAWATRLEYQTKLYPSVLIALSFFSVFPLRRYGLHGIAVSLIVPAVLSVLSRRVGLKFIIWSAVWIVLLYLNESRMSSPWFSRLSYDETALQVKCVADDTSIIGRKLNWLPEAKNVEMAVVCARVPGETDWRKSKGRIFVKLPEKTPLSYGDEVLMDGILCRPDDESSAIQKKAGFAGYLKSRGITRIFRADSIKVLHSAAWPYSTMKLCLDIRDIVLDACCSGLGNPESASFLAGFFFNCRQGIDYVTKDKFMMTGTLHILAISGMHITLFAMIILFLLRPVPIRIRYMIVPFMILFYTAIIGFPPSAVRAFVMVSVFCIHKFTMTASKPFNLLALAAVIILLLNPFAVMDIGFQYSFVLIAFLMLSRDAGNRLSDAVCERLWWVPKNKLTSMQGWGIGISRGVALNLFSVITAGIASTGITLYYNSILIPWSLLVNLLAVPLNFPLFIFAGAKIIFRLSGMTFPADIANFFLNGTVRILYEIITIGRNGGDIIPVKEASLCSMFVFYSLLAIIFIFKNKAVMMASLLSITAVIISWFVFSVYLPERMICYQPAGDKPLCVIVCNPADSSATVVNYPGCGEFDFKNILVGQGVSHVSALYLCNATPKTLERLVRLEEIFKVDKVFVPQSGQKEKPMKRLMDKISRSCVPAEFYSPDDIMAAGKKVRITSREVNPGRRMAEIEIEGHRYGPFVILNSNREAVIADEILN